MENAETQGTCSLTLAYKQIEDIVKLQADWNKNVFYY